MNKVLAVIGLVALLTGCEGMYPPDDGIPRIRSQRDIDTYNATVSSESEKLVCSREAALGSNIRKFVCMTIAQRDRLALQSQQAIQDLDSLSNN